MLSEISKEQNDIRWFTLQNSVNEMKIARAFELLKSAGVEPIMIKGWSAARYYPQIWQRQFSDIDLCVAPEDYERAEKLLAKSEANTFNIDLHKGLRHLDTVAWENLFANSEEVKINQTEIRVLRAEDHLRVLCVHWLTDGGADKERLRDIYYLIESRRGNFEWNRCLEMVSAKRQKWIIACIGLAHKYLGLKLDETPVAEAAEDLPLWLIRAVEKEWESKVRLKPLHACLDDRSQLWEQIKKRIPPNPVQATIELEGSFDNKPRVFYQFANVFTRLSPSLKRVIGKISENIKR